MLASSSSASTASSFSSTMSPPIHEPIPGASNASARRRPLPQLTKTYSCASTAAQMTKSYPPPVRNRLAEQENKPMNQTFTLGQRVASAIPPHGRRNRSSSIDSDFGDYTIHGAITGLFPRSIPNGKSLANHISRKAYTHCSQSTAAEQRKYAQNLSSASATLWAACAKLPSLEGCSPDRKCCQKPFSSSTQFELAKYKDTLKNN